MNERAVSHFRNSPGVWLGMSAVCHRLTGLLMAVVVLGLSACDEQRTFGEFGPHEESTIPAEDKQCIRAARTRIAALGKQAFESAGWDVAQRGNLDPVSGEVRWDVWAGAHLFSLPMQAFEPSYRYVASLPGTWSMIPVQVDALLRTSDNAHAPYRDDLVKIEIECNPHVSIVASRDFVTAWKRQFHERLQRPGGVVTREWGLQGIRVGRYADYLAADSEFGLPDGDPYFGCMYELRASRYANCETRFTYRDSVIVRIRFDAKHLPEWRAILTKVLALLDDAYRGDA